jgi:hypothetical protein
MDTHQYPQQVATWEIDDETGEVEDMGSYTNYPDQ